MTTSSRYQTGTLERLATKAGDCWYLRINVTGQDGTTARRRLRVGLLRDFPTKAAAARAAEPVRRRLNEQASIVVAPRYMADVIDRYEREEMPPRYSTAKAYRAMLKNHISPRWGRTPLTDVRAQGVREWLRSLPLSTKTRGHIRDMMRTLFRFAMLWEWVPLTDNPMSLFRLERSTTRTKEPIILTPEDFLRLLRHRLLADEPYRTMLLLAACLGIRSSEIGGLQWRDVDWASRKLRIERAVVEGRVDDVKTKRSRAPLPLHDDVLSALREYHSRSLFTNHDDYIFASPHSAGEKTYHMQGIQQKKISKAAKELGLGDSVGWHTFRHSHRAWLGRSGASLTVQRDLMRHANIATTIDVYGGSFDDDLRLANEKVVRMVIQ